MRRRSQQSKRTMHGVVFQAVRKFDESGVQIGPTEWAAELPGGAKLVVWQEPHRRGYRGAWRYEPPARYLHRERAGHGSSVKDAAKVGLSAHRHAVDYPKPAPEPDALRRHLDAHGADSPKADR